MRRRGVVRGWQKVAIAIFLTAAGCSLLLLNRCRVPSASPDVGILTSVEDLRGGGESRTHHLPEELPAIRHHLRQEDQRTAYTRHLLQQIAQLEQEVAALHAAAAAGRPPAARPIGDFAADTLASAIPQIQPLPQIPRIDPATAEITTNKAPSFNQVFDTSDLHQIQNSFSIVSNSTLVLDAPCTSLLKQQILQSEVVKGVPLNNEYEVVPFSHFSWSRVYPSELGLGKRVVEKPIGYRRKDLLSALTSALNHLNYKQTQISRFTVDDFIEGSFRVIPTVGMQYELVFRDRNAKSIVPPSSTNNGGDSPVTSSDLKASNAHKIKSDVPKDINNNNSSTYSGLSEKSSRHYSGKDLKSFPEDRERRKEGSSNVNSKENGKKLNSSSTNVSSKQHSRTPGASLKTVTLMRPFAPITIVQSKTNSARQLINIILPLSGRLETFQRFMSKLTTVILPHDRRIFLTVVYFADDGLQKARNIITKASREANFRMVKLLTLNETFSRGKALQVGAQHWSGGDVLLFMCDVDVVFSTRFLDRCRIHSSPGKSVYYPVIFSLYNPGLVYPLQGKPIPEELEQLIISRDTGFWRDFGYGMTCQYRSDFLNVNGFDQQIVGWGGEDVLLYRKYVRSTLNVVRAPDPGLFHLWHPKLCSPGLPGDQYRACISSRALSEASHAHLGLVAFKKDLEKHSVAAKILPGINTAERNLNNARGYQATGEM